MFYSSWTNKNKRAMMAPDCSPDLYCTNGDLRDISVILFQNQPGCLEVVLRFVYF